MEAWKTTTAAASTKNATITQPGEADPDDQYPDTWFQATIDFPATTSQYSGKQG